MPESLFLRACRGETTPRPPVWFMRQAGRYLPEYRAIREKHGFLVMATTPELACEVTLQPVRRLGVDAAILFADILLPLAPMGAPFHFAEGEGPVIERPIREPKDIERLRVPDGEELSYVGRTLELVLRELRPETALIGFAGAPFTLASYLIEGGHSKSFERTKRLMWEAPEAWDSLMNKLALTCLGYLKMQAAHGAQALQLFDSWVGCLSPEDYARSVLPHTRRIFQGLAEGPTAEVPTIHFGVDTASLLRLQAQAGGDVIGVDWRLPLPEARRLVGKARPLQGNLDPIALLGSPELALRETRRILDEGRGGPHLFNVGHGLVPQTPPDNVLRVVELVKAG
ncbi:MAG: uroporphyrinogen decarboxylase [Deltaproteobacteria bacterium]